MTNKNGWSTGSTFNLKKYFANVLCRAFDCTVCVISEFYSGTVG